MLARRGTEDEHSRLIDIAQLTMERLSQDKQLTRTSDPMLLHWDLHKRNIYVSAEDPTHVTSIIDWQFTSIEPIFIYANDTPDFAEISNALAAKDEEALATPCISSTQDEHSRRDSLICRKTFEVIIAAKLPRLAAARAIDDTMLRLFRYCRSSHTSSDLVLRHELLELSRLWSELNMSKLKLFLMDKLDSSSEEWVSPESWQSARNANKVFLKQWMEVVGNSEDPDMNEVRGRGLWPWEEK
ncbi:hypothetical protein LTR64_005221 [Lithohypha guttulata]|uniref:uncharacterized protein n=1 Tax=Lithohypha guttulata TaxID=1690604 RepID=UPI00315D432B